MWSINRSILLVSVLALLSSATSDISAEQQSSPTTTLAGHEECDYKTYPLAPPSDHHTKNRVTIPGDTSHRQHAPLCPDGRHINIRQLVICQPAQCWSATHQQCFHITSQECTNPNPNVVTITNPGVNVVGTTVVGANVVGTTTTNGVVVGGNIADGNLNLGTVNVQTQTVVKAKTCGAGQCYVYIYDMCMHVTSQECLNPPPTPRPTPLPRVVTSHPVDIRLTGLPVGYVLTAEEQARILRFAKEKLEGELVGDIQFVEVKYVGSTPVNTGEQSVALDVSVKGTIDMNDFALSYVMDGVNGPYFKDDLATVLKEENFEVFKDVSVQTGTYDTQVVIVYVPGQVPVSAPPPPTPRPTGGKVISDEYVRIVFLDVDPNYRITLSEQNSIIDWVQSVVEDELPNTLELVNVQYVEVVDDGIPNFHMSFQVRGNVADMQFAEDYIRNALLQNESELIGHVKGLDFDAFRDVYVDVEPYDYGSLNVYDTDDNMVLKEKEFPTQIICKNLAPKYRMSSRDRDSTVEYVGGLIKDRMNRQGFEVADVKLSGEIQYWKENFMLPLRVVTKQSRRRVLVRPQHDDSDRRLDEVQDEIDSLMEESADDIMAFLAALDPDSDAFDNAGISFASDDFDEPNYAVSLHQLEIFFKHTPDSYQLSDDDRDSVVKYVRNLLRGEIDDELKVLEVTFADNEILYGPEMFWLPMYVVIIAPQDKPELIVLSEAMEVLSKDSSINGLVGYMESLTDESLPDIVTRVDSFEEEELEDVVTEYRVQFIVKNLPDDYRLTDRESESVVRYVDDYLEGKTIRDDLEVVAVLSRGTKTVLYGPSMLWYRMHVITKGQPDLEGLGLAYVLDKVQDEDSMYDFKKYIVSLDGDTFQNTRSLTTDIDLSAATYDENELNHEIVDHPCDLTFTNLPDDFRLSEKDRDTLVNFVEELVDEVIEAEDDLELVDISYAGRRMYFRGDTLWLPMRVTTKGSSDAQGFALSYIMDILRPAANEEILTYSKVLSYDYFKDAGVEAGVYPWEDLLNDITDVTVNVILVDVPKDYRLSPQVRKSLEEYVFRLLKESLDERLELIEVGYGGRTITDGNRRGLHSRVLQYTQRPTTKYVPLRASVSGPPELAEYVALYIMQAIEDHEEEIGEYLKSLDPSLNALDDFPVEVTEFDPNEMPLDEIDYPVKLSFENLSEGHSLPQNDREYVTDFVQKSLESSLPSLVELTSVEDAGKLLQTRVRRLQSGQDAMPIQVGVESPNDVSDFVLPYILESLRDDVKELEDDLGKMNPDAYSDVIIRVGTYDHPNDLVSSQPKALQAEGSTLPWWAILLCVLLILLCCCCVCACLGLAYRKKRVDETIIKEEVVFKKEAPVMEQAPIAPLVAPVAPVVYHIEAEKKKPRHKKKKKRSRSKPREVELHSNDTPENLVIVPYHNGDSTIAVESAVTMFRIDPPEESMRLTIEPEYPPMLALPPPTEEPLLLTGPDDHDTDHQSVHYEEASYSVSHVKPDPAVHHHLSSRKLMDHSVSQEPQSFLALEAPGTYPSEQSYGDEASYATQHPPPTPYVMQAASTVQTQSVITESPPREKIRRHKRKTKNKSPTHEMGAPSVHRIKQEPSGHWLSNHEPNLPPVRQVRGGQMHPYEDESVSQYYEEARSQSQYNVAAIQARQQPGGQVVQQNPSNIFATFEDSSFATQSHQFSQSIHGMSSPQYYGNNPVNSNEHGVDSAADEEDYGRMHMNSF